MLARLRAWWLDRVRGFGPGRHQPDGWYIRLTPSLGFSFPWKGRRVRWAPHHGLQLVEWRWGRDTLGEVVGRWVVARQLYGRSSVKGERYIPPIKPSAANISSIS